jgi:hypothetical protein
MPRAGCSWVGGALVVSFGGLLASAGCDDLLGFQHSLGGACLHNSECPDPLTCIFKVCTVQCNEDRDCLEPELAPVCIHHRCTARQDADVTGADATGNEYLDSQAEVVNDDHGASTCGETVTNVNNCGSCGNTCAGNHVHWGCVSSACVAQGCEPGWGDCNGNPGDGCETDVTGDSQNCSHCGHVCSSGVCQSSNCLAETEIGALGTPSSAAPTIIFDSRLMDTNIAQLVGVKIYVDQPSVVTKLAIVSVIGGARAYLGVYDTDVRGNPTTLLTTTGEFVLLGDALRDINPQATVVNVPHTNLQSKAYWILGQWDRSLALQLSQGTRGCMQGDLGCIQWYQLGEQYGPLPNPAPLAQYVYNPTPILYAIVAQ